MFFFIVPHELILEIIDTPTSANTATLNNYYYFVRSVSYSDEPQLLNYDAVFNIIVQPSDKTMFEQGDFINALPMTSSADYSNWIDILDSNNISVSDMLDEDITASDFASHTLSSSDIVINAVDKDCSNWTSEYTYCTVSISAQIRTMPSYSWYTFENDGKAMFVGFKFKGEIEIPIG